MMSWKEINPDGYVDGRRDRLIDEIVGSLRPFFNSKVHKFLAIITFLASKMEEKIACSLRSI